MDELWQFPFTWAAVDDCHIPIKCPPGGNEACKEFHNFKNFYSFVLMSLVDAKYRFIWESCGSPGNSHDSIILQSTSLWIDIKDGMLLPNFMLRKDNVLVLPILLGDSAFPFETWLMKPFSKAVLSKQEIYFNYRLSRAKMVVECAYGQLKGRWRLLLNLQMPSVKFTQCQTVSRNILRSSPNANVQALWKNTSTGPNLQYDIYRNTREVLKAVKLGNRERLTHNLPSQGALLSFLLDHSLKKLNGIWSGVQSNLPVNIYNFTIKYLDNTLPTRKNLCLWKLRQSSDCQFCLLSETLLHVVAGCKVYLEQCRYTW